jgi:hypothetical protein
MGKNLLFVHSSFCFLNFLDGGSDTIIGGIGDLIGENLNHLVLEIPLEDITQILVYERLLITNDDDIEEEIFFYPSEVSLNLV